MEQIAPTTLSALSVDFWDYAVFLGLVLFSMIVDHVMHKDDKTISLKSAINWSVFWVVISLIYAGFLFVHHDSNTASLFVSGYVLEKVLSVDNLFVFSAIFAWFKVPNQYRHRILYWGIIGAIVFRLIFVVIGAGLLQQFGSYAEILFAALILYAAVMMLDLGKTGVIMLKVIYLVTAGGLLWQNKSYISVCLAVLMIVAALFIKIDNGDDEEEINYENHIANKIVHKFFPVVPRLFGHNFFVKGKQIEKELANGTINNEDKNAIERVLGVIKSSALYATPLLVCAAVMELSDVMFAFDSVPAVIAISKEPLVVYSSMLFAILGLRTLYFVLEALKDLLHHLEKAIVVLLFFIAIKMGASASLHLTGYGFDISPNISLIIVLGVLAVGVIASLINKKKPAETE